MRDLLDRLDGWRDEQIEFLAILAAILAERHRRPRGAAARARGQRHL